MNPYLKEIDYDSRNLYQYAMENLSMDYQNEVTQLKTDIEMIANRVKKKKIIRNLQSRFSFTFAHTFSIRLNSTVIGSVHQGTDIV